MTVSLKNSSTSTAKTEASYTYDELGQLIRQDCSYSVINITVIYEYDSNGNILSKKEYKYWSHNPMPEEPTSTVVYGYSDTSWKDKLTSYNGEEITYDANGNPLSYRDGISLAWKNGRSLAELNNGAKNTKTTYTYNEDGIRIMKDFEGIKTRYLLDGTNIIAQEVTNGDSLDYIYFFYDASGSPVGMNYLGYNYYYKKNLQGDIIEIWGTEDGTDNHTFRCLVKYVYDAWGNILQMNDTTDGWFKVGTANPFRYRGYYYDNESGFYYLQSRYYDPATGRFLNADDTAYIGATDTASGYNLFSYCENNAPNYTDITGHSKIAEYGIKVLEILMLILPYLNLAGWLIDLFMSAFSWYGKVKFAIKIFATAVYLASIITDFYILENGRSSRRKMVAAAKDLFVSTVQTICTWIEFRYSKLVSTLKRCKILTKFVKGVYSVWANVLSPVVDIGTILKIF